MRRYTGRALLAAATVASEAYSNISPAGALFLALFLAWGQLATRLTSPGGTARASLVLWSIAAAASWAALLLQTLVLLLPHVGGGPNSFIWRALGLRDLSQCSALEVLAVLSPPLLCALMALAEAQDAYTAFCCGNRVDSSGRGVSTAAVAEASPHREGTSGSVAPETVAIRPMGPSLQQASERIRTESAAEPVTVYSSTAPKERLERRTLGRVGGHGGDGPATVGGSGPVTNVPIAVSAAAAALFVMLATLLWPAVFNLPWLLLASCIMAMWALRLGIFPALHAPILRLYQVYCGTAITVLYLWQLKTPDAWPTVIVHGSRALGLYRFYDSSMEGHLCDAVLKALHAAALTSLYAALGFAASTASETWRRRRQRHMGRGWFIFPPGPVGPTFTLPVSRAPADTALREPLLLNSQAMLTPSDVSTTTTADSLVSTRARPPATVNIPDSGRFRRSILDRETMTQISDQGDDHQRPPLPPPPLPHHKQQQQQHYLQATTFFRHRHHHESHHHGGSHMMMEHLAAWVVAAIEGLTDHPGVAAVALAGLSMVEVSVLGGALLAVGMWALLAPGRYGRRMLRSISPVLTLLLLIWNTAVYVVTCLSASYPELLPPVLHSLGLFMYVSPPPVVLPLSGQAIAIVAMAGLARSSRGRGAPGSMSTGHRHSSGRDGINAGGAGVGGDGNTGGGGDGGGGGGNAARTSLGSSSVRSALLLVLYHILHVLVPGSWILLGSYKTDLLHGVYLLSVLSYCGATAVRLIPDPRVGTVLPDIRQSDDDALVVPLDGGQDVADSAAATSASSIATDTAAPVASIITAPKSARNRATRAASLPFPASPPAHRLLRLYASMHLLALYAAMCGQLPGLGFLQPKPGADVLRLVGLWAPSRSVDCLPLLAALVLATAHAVAGKLLTAAAAAASRVVVSGSNASVLAEGPQLSQSQTLEHPQQQSQLSRSAAPSATVQTWLLTFGESLGSAASSVGYLLIFVILYVLVLYDTQVCMLGLGYLALGLPLLMAPPRRDQYVALMRLSHHRSGLLHGHGQATQRPLLTTWRSRDLMAARVRWLAPAVMALYCGLDLCMSYSIAMLAVYGPSPGDGWGRGGTSGRKIAKWWWSIVEVLYGQTPPMKPGVSLVLTLIRPCSLLLAMQLYRWAFAAAAVRKWMRRHDCYIGGGESMSEGEGETLLTQTRDSALSAAAMASSAATPPLPPRRLAQQASASWFVKRWIILNVDLLCGTVLFAAAMASPGVLSLGLLVAAVAAAQAATWRAAAVVAAGPDAATASARQPGRSPRRVRVGDAVAAVGFFVLAQLMLAAGVLILYGVQLAPVAGWLREVSAPAGGGEAFRPWSPAAVLDWLGLPLCGTANGPPPTPTPLPKPPPFPLPLSPPLPSPSLPIWRQLSATPDSSFNHPAAAAVRGEFLRQLLAGATASAIFAGGTGSRDDADSCAPVPGLRLRLGLGLLALAALALRGKARRWRSKLPPELVAAAAPGQPSCLFWPPPSSRPDAAVVEWLGHRAPLHRAVRRALAPMASVTSQVLSRLGRGAYDVLKAMDVPADQLVVPGGGDASSTADVEEAKRQARSPAPHASGCGGGAGGADGSKEAGQRGVREMHSPGATPSTASGGISEPAAAARDIATAGPAVAGVSPHQSYDTASGVGSGARTPAVRLMDGAVGGGGGGGGDAGGRRRGHRSCADDLTSRFLMYLQLFVRGLMEAWEHAWSEWGGEVALLSLLLAAFTCCSVLSLLLLAALGAGMATRPAVHAALRRHAILPILGVVLLYQYSAWVGLLRLVLPALGRPSPYPAPSDVTHLQPALAAWLGLQRVGPLVPWALFGALAACLMQVNTELGKLQEEQEQQHREVVDGRSGAAASRPSGRERTRRIAGRGPGLWRLPWRRTSWIPEGAAVQEEEEEEEDRGSNDLEAPLLTAAPAAAEPARPLAASGATIGTLEGSAGGSMSVVSLARQRPEPVPTAPSGTALGKVARSSKGGGTGGDGGGDGGGVRLFSPMSSWAQPYWGVLDWCRYYLIRHAADVLLVALVGLVALQRDLLRAGYLAHCLLLFRRRQELSAPGGAGGALFGRLVGFNFLVLLLEGVFQAPWELILGASWALPCSLAALRPDGGGEAAAPVCTFPRLVGLCQLQPGRPAAVGVWFPWSSLANSPVAADVVVWLLLRLYVRVLRSQLFARVAAVAAAAQQQHVAALRQEVEHAREAAARGALAASHARAVRNRRIAMLKALLLSPGDAEAADGPALAGVEDDDGNGRGTAALAAYYRALRDSGTGGSGGSGGGGRNGSGRGLLMATGGGPQVAGLADLLDDDVDLHDMAAAAAAAGLDLGSGQRRGVSWQLHRHFLVTAHRLEADRYGGTRGGEGRGGDVRASSGGDRSGAVARTTSLAHELLEEGAVEPTGARSRAARRTQSYGDLRDLEHDLDALSPASLHPVSAVAAAAAGTATASTGRGVTRRYAAAEYAQPAQQRGSGGMASVHRRFASADTLPFVGYDEAPAHVADGGRSAVEMEAVAAAAAAAAAQPSHPEEYHGPGSRGGGGGGRGTDRRPQLPRLSWPPLLVWLYGKIVAPLEALAQRRRLDDDSYTCYVAYLSLFLADMSVLSAVTPLSMLLYCLLLTQKPRQYWQAALLYTEGVLILQYSYLVMGNCLCATDAGAGDPSCMWIFGRRDFMYRVQLLGLHTEPSRCLLLFITYLATLMHSYSLDTVYAAVTPQPPLPPPLQQQQRQESQQQRQASAPAGAAVTVADAADRGVVTGEGIAPPLISFRRLRWQLRRGARSIRRLVLHLLKVYGLVTSQHEVGPYWVNLQLALPAPKHQRLRGAPQTTTQPQSTPQAAPQAAPPPPPSPPPQLQPPTEEPQPPPPARPERRAGLPPRPPLTSATISSNGNGEGDGPQRGQVPQPGAAASPALLSVSTPGVEALDTSHLSPVGAAQLEIQQATVTPPGECATGGVSAARLTEPGLCVPQSSPPGVVVEPAMYGVVSRWQQPTDAVQEQGQQIVHAVQHLLTAVYDHGRLVAYLEQQEAVLRRQRRRRQRQQATAWQVTEWAEDEGDSDCEGGEGEEADKEEDTVEQRRSGGGGGSGSGASASRASRLAASTTGDEAGAHASTNATAAAAAAGTAAAAAAIVTRFARYSLPQLRLQHGPLPSRTAIHVLLEIVPPLPPALATTAGVHHTHTHTYSDDDADADANFPSASPTPAHDVALVLRFCSEVLRRQRQPAPVLLFRRAGNGGDRSTTDGHQLGSRGSGVTGYISTDHSRPPLLPLATAPSLSRECQVSDAEARIDAGASSSSTVAPMDTEQQAAGEPSSFLRLGPSLELATQPEAGLRQRRAQPATAASGSGGSIFGPAYSIRRQSSIGFGGSLVTADSDAPPPLPAGVGAGAGAVQVRAPSTPCSPPLPPPSPPLPPPLLAPKLQLPESLDLPAILSVESYSKPPQDLYGPTAVLDLISFMYALVFYQFVVFSARSLADITDVDRRLPLDYLAALMLLFGIMVSDRAVYMLGWPAAKMALHITSMVFVLGWCLRAFWESVAATEGLAGGAAAAAAAAAESSVRWHLRVFMLLRCCGLALGALQLRDGFPPLSSPGPAGGGRHSSFFYRRADWAHQLAFNIFYALPFLYEVRTLLDWTCISTSMDWYSWLKLEDIRSSLYIATCRNMERRGRRLGQRVPRYVKFMQGFLALVALLLVLWLPPLFFSSGAPTYQVPALVDVRVNISISRLSGGPDGLSTQRFPLYSSGDRRVIFQWTAPTAPQPAPAAAAAAEGETGVAKRRRLSLGSQAAAKKHTIDRAVAAVAAAPPPRRAVLPPPPVPPGGGGGGRSGGGGGGGSGSSGVLPRALASYAPDQAIGVCLAAESDEVWRISPPARKALLNLLLGPGPKPAQTPPPQPPPPSGRSLRGDGSAWAWGSAEGADSDPVVLEIGWSFTRSAPLTSQYGGPSCTAATYVPLSEHARRGLAEVLSGTSNRTLLTALNETDPASAGAPGLFPLFVRLKGEACSVRLGLQGEGQSGQSGKHRVGLGAGGPTEGTWRRRLLSWRSSWMGGSGDGRVRVRGGGGGGGGDISGVAAVGARGAADHKDGGSGGGGGAAADAVATAADAADAADLWGSALVGCYAVREGGSGAGSAEWWSFQCGALLPPAGPAADGRAEGADPDGALAAEDDDDDDDLQAAALLRPRGLNLPHRELREGYSDVRESAATVGGGGGGGGSEGLSAVGGRGGGGGRDPQPGRRGGHRDWSSKGDDEVKLADPCGSAPGGSPGLTGPPLVAVVEPVQSGLLGATLSRFGITGLYVTFVFAIGRFLRLSVSSLRLRIPTEDLPSTRRLVALCQDIYVARAEGELVLEEQLFRALINVYRSPELLFELSRKKHKQA